MNKLRIFADSDPMNPRTEMDNLGTIAYKHRKYCLGEEKISDPIEWLEEMLGLQPNMQSRERFEELESMFFKKFIALPLYLYDHSGITIATTPFGCNWDSGKVGYIYITKAKAREEYSWKNITAKRREQLERYLRSEVETYDQFLTGDIYRFVVEDENGEHVDSCSGFFGTNWETNGIKDHIEDELWPQLEGIEIEYDKY